MCNISAASWQERATFRWDDDDDVRFVIDQHYLLDFYSDSQLKQSEGLTSHHYDILSWFWVNLSLTP